MTWRMRRDYLPALGFRFLTQWYDPVVALTTREGTVKRRLLDHAALRPGLRLLDLGCGTGTLAIMAKERERAIWITGVDGDPAVLGRARAKAAARALDIEFVDGRATALPFERADFDLVLCSLFLHHLWPHERLATLGEVQRVLRPGGRLLVADWGAPHGVFARAGFTLVRMTDGFARTRDHAEGRLPQLFTGAAFECITQCDEISTPIGTMVLFSMHTAGTPLPTEPAVT